MHPLAFLSLKVGLYSITLHYSQLDPNILIKTLHQSDHFFIFPVRDFFELETPKAELSEQRFAHNLYSSPST